MFVLKDRGAKAAVAMIALAMASMMDLGAQAGPEAVAAGPNAAVPVKSAFELSAGWLTDGGAGNGLAAIIRSKSFIGTSPFYYGFGSTTGTFMSTGEAVFETAGFFGYEAPLFQGAVGLDACLNLVAFGGRVDASLHYRQESPAVQPILALAFPAAADFAVSLFAAPLIRPYDLEGRAWNFSRSYLLAGIQIQANSFLMGVKRPWAESLR